MTRPADIPPHIYEWAEIFCDDHRHIEDDRELVARAYMMAGQGAVTVPRRAGLTPIQASVLRFIKQYQAEHRSSPSYTDIANACGLSSKSGVHRVVHALVERRAIAMLPYRSRSISVVGKVA